MVRWIAFALWCVNVNGVMSSFRIPSKITVVWASQYRNRNLFCVTSKRIYHLPTNQVARQNNATTSTLLRHKHTFQKPYNLYISKEPLWTTHVLTDHMLHKTAVLALIFVDIDSDIVYMYNDHVQHVLSVAMALRTGTRVCWHSYVYICRVRAANTTQIKRSCVRN